MCVPRRGDGTKIDFEPADVIYVSAGATRPVDLWLDRLKDGGRLIRMLTLDKKFGRAGAFFRIERRGDGFLAKWIFAGDIFPCEGARDAESERALATALDKGGWERVTRLYRRGDLPDERLRSVYRLPVRQAHPAIPRRATIVVHRRKSLSPGPSRALDCPVIKVGCGAGTEARASDQRLPVHALYSVIPGSDCIPPGWVVNRPSQGPRRAAKPRRKRSFICRRRDAIVGATPIFASNVTARSTAVK